MSHKRRIWPWVAVLIGVPVLYVLSFIPIYWAMAHYRLWTQPTAARIVYIHGFPMRCVYDCVPGMRHYLRVYDEFLVKVQK